MKNITYFRKDTLICGDVIADEVVIEGNFNGKIIAKGDVYMKSTAVVMGSVYARNFFIEDGADCEANLILYENQSNLIAPKIGNSVY